MMTCCKKETNEAGGRRPGAAAMEEETPMRRYAGPLPVRTPSCPGRGGQTAVLEQLLEQTCRQNQLLLDLLGAVNGLTGAVLARGRNGE